MAGGGDIIIPGFKGWEGGPGLTPPEKRVSRADLPVGVARIGQPITGDLLSIATMQTIVDAVPPVFESPMDLTLVAADELKNSMQTLRAAEIDRSDAELDFRHIFFNELTPEERDELIHAHPEIDLLIADINNGYRYTDRTK